jgi:hypothetical protein
LEKCWRLTYAAGDVLGLCDDVRVLNLKSRKRQHRDCRGLRED